MKKVIVLSTVLGLSALGMACGDVPANNANANKPANTPAPVSTPMSTPASTPASNMTNGNSAMKPANSNSAMKPAMTPSPSPTKKP